MDNCIFRAMGPEEAPRMIELVRERIAWMDREGLQSWNTSDYLEIYPQDYYEERAREGVLFALARASDGKILCAGQLPFLILWERISVLCGPLRSTECWYLWQ